jgi:hypothetical protein
VTGALLTGLVHGAQGTSIEATASYGGEFIACASWHKGEGPEMLKRCERERGGEWGLVRVSGREWGSVGAAAPMMLQYNVPLH